MIQERAIDRRDYHAPRNSYETARNRHTRFMYLSQRFLFDGTADRSAGYRQTGIALSLKQW